MNISGIGPLNENKRVGSSTDRTPRRPSAPKSDAVSLSPEGLDAWVQAAKNQPDTRPDAVDRAAQRAAAGFYNQPQTIQQTAENLLKSGDLEIVDEPAD